MARNREGRSPLGEILFWVVLLGADALAMYLIHRSFGQPYNYMDTMPYMLPVGAFVPLLAAVLRYFPKKKGPRIVGIVVALALGIVIGQAALRGFYGDHPFIIEAIYGRNVDPFMPEEIEAVYGTLYEDGAPVSEELKLGGAWVSNTQTYRGVRSLPEKTDWVQLRVAGKDGTERKLMQFCDDQWDYLEEPGVGAWRRKQEEHWDYYNWRENCVDREFDAAFKAPLEAGETPKLSPDYDGAEKAAWIDWTREGYNDELYMEVSWTANASHGDYTRDSDTPEGYLPERARDVRWLFVKERTGHVYQGYWYEVGTGKKVSDSYENTYAVTVYDLATGEQQVVSESDSSWDTGESVRRLDIGNCMRAYFGIEEE